MAQRIELGVNALVFGDGRDEAAIRRATTDAAACGYGLIEGVIFDPAKARPAATGLAAVTGMALNPAADFSSPDLAIAAAGERLIADAISATRDMGASCLGGVTHSAMMRHLAAAAPGTLSRVTDSYARLAEKAARKALAAWTTHWSDSRDLAICALARMKSDLASARRAKAAQTRDRREELDRREEGVPA